MCALNIGDSAGTVMSVPSVPVTSCSEVPSESGEGASGVIVSHSSGGVLSDIKVLFCEEADASGSLSVSVANTGKVFDAISRAANAVASCSFIFIYVCTPFHRVCGNFQQH